MSGCTDKRYENMLHAFEMGMLSDDDYNAFRLHLLDCQHCFERAQKIETAIEIMRDDADIREIPQSIINEQSKPAAVLPEEKKPLFKVRFWPTLVPTTAIVAIIIVFLVMKPWQFEIRSTQEAVASENRMAIMYFENLASPGDPQKLGEITASLLITDLSESSYLQVVSSQRLHDILRLMDKEGSRITDKEIALQIAGKADARWMLTGSILQIEPELVVNSQLVEVASGDLIASQSLTGNEGEDVFSLVDRLTVLVKNDLSLPVAALQEPDRRVADVTTHSPEAYRYYLEGVANWRRAYKTEAKKSLRKALELDSSFAMVYYILSQIDDPTLIDLAVKYIDRAGRDRAYFIRSQKAYLSEDYDLAIRELQASLEYYPDNKEAYFRIGVCYSMKLDFEKTIQYCKKAVEIDPLFKIAYNQMAYTYDWMGDFENAIKAIDMYISLAPQEANPYDTRADIYSSNGRLASANDSYLSALEIKPDFWTSLHKLGRNYLFLNQFTVADSCFRELADCNDHQWRSIGRAALAYVPLYLGKFDEALNILGRGIAADAAEIESEKYSLCHYLKAIIYEEQNLFDSAIWEYEESIRIYRLQYPNDEKYYQHLLAAALAKNGEIQKAETEAENLRKIMVTEKDTLRYWYAAASIELAKGNLEEALRGFEKAAADSVIPYAPANYMLASVYMEAGRWSDAIAEVNKILTNDFTDTRPFYGNWVARIYYLKGVAYEEMGHNDSAIEQYRIFLDLWKDADPGIDHVADAAKRLARLESRL